MGLGGAYLGRLAQGAVAVGWERPAWSRSTGYRRWWTAGTERLSVVAAYPTLQPPGSGQSSRDFLPA